MYDKLNEYLNQLCNDNEDSFYIENINYFANLIGCYKKVFYNRTYRVPEKYHLTFAEVYELAREIIGSYPINKEEKIKYLELFDEMLNNGILDFSYEHEYDDSHMETEYDEFEDKLTYRVNINLDFSYQDVRVLIHEFMHYIHHKKAHIIEDNKMIISRSQKDFTEFISIYFEFYAIRYLKNKYNISEKLINSNSRIVTSLKRARALYLGEILISAYKKFGDIDDNTYEYVNRYICKMSKEQYDEELITFIEHLNDFKTAVDFSQQYMKNFEYFMGTIFAIYAINNIPPKKMINFISETGNNLKDGEDILNELGIPFDKIKQMGSKNNPIINDIITNTYENFDKEFSCIETITKK